MMEEINDKQSDAELIRTVLGGNRDEFRHLVRKYQNQVFAMIRRQVNNNPIAEDLTQETFLRAFKGLKSFDHRACFSTWLIRIALNTTSTYFSSAQYKKQRLTNNYEETQNIESTNDSLKTNELRAQLQQALAGLKPIYREVLVLCGLEGRSYEEVAAMLNIPVGTVRSRLNKARLEAIKVISF